MSGATTELSLSTAVDSDDNADYLTIALANSLRTVDALFNNDTGHTHSGAHQGGPIGAIPVGSIPDGSITSAKIQDGTIATADLANNAVTNAKLGTDTARLNLLTNGGFEIWQRGNGPFTANGAYSADRWLPSLAGTDTISISSNAANIDIASALCAAVTFTLGTGAGGSALVQILRENAAPGVNGKTITFSVRARTSTANAVRAALYNGSAWTYGAYHSGGGAYETLSVSLFISGGPSSIWVGPSFAASCTAYIDNAMLVLGSVPADYAPLHPADDLARCLRYYESVSCTNNGAMLPAMAYGAANAQFLWSFKVAKAVAPTITSTPAGQAALLSATGTALTATAVDSFVANPGQAQGRVAVASGLVAGNATQVIAGSGTSAILWAESNP